MKKRILALLCTASLLFTTAALPVQAEPNPMPELRPVNTDDALDILNSIVGLTEPLPLDPYDFNKNGVIDVGDALEVLKSIVGLREVIMVELESQDQNKIKNVMDAIREIFLNHLDYTPKELILSHVETYKKCVVFYDVTSKRIFERFWFEINGHTLNIDNPLLYFYIFETNTFIPISQLSHHNLQELFTPEELSDFAEKAAREFARIERSEEFWRVKGGYTIEEWEAYPEWRRIREAFLADNELV